MNTPLSIDGNLGGGQILRSSLALSMVTGRPFRITAIRGQRSRPGLLRQHLTCVRAAARLCDAQTVGATLGSTALDFVPGPLKGGALEIAVGTAGSALLVLQSVAPALLCGPEQTTLTLSGGTHNPAAPSFEFVTDTWAPAVGRIGGAITGSLERWGFFPAGGGQARFTVEPWSTPQPFVRMRTEGPLKLSAEVVLSQLPKRIAAAERERLLERLGAKGLLPEDIRVRRIRDSHGPGNIVTVVARDTAGLTARFVSHGMRGRAAAAVADDAADRCLAWLEAGVAIDGHLADQMLLPMALGAGGRFSTTAATAHTRTNAALIQRFLDVEIELRERGAGRCHVVVRTDRG